MAFFVGVAGFEPTTLWSQTRCATGLRYTPKNKFTLPLKCAEREGFEPSVHFKGVRRFSKPVLSATQPPLRFPYFRDCKVRNKIFIKQEIFYFFFYITISIYTLG